MHEFSSELGYYLTSNFGVSRLKKWLECQEPHSSVNVFDEIKTNDNHFQIHPIIFFLTQSSRTFVTEQPLNILVNQTATRCYLSDKCNDFLYAYKEL